MPVAKKTRSVVEMGLTIEPIKGKDKNGNEFVYRLRGKEPKFFVKRMKRSGKLLVFKEKDAQTDSTVNGLYDLVETHTGGKLDLIGRRVGEPSPKKPPKSANQTPIPIKSGNTQTNQQSQKAA